MMMMMRSSQQAVKGRQQPPGEGGTVAGLKGACSEVCDHPADSALPARTAGPLLLRQEQEQEQAAAPHSSSRWPI
jgi:hypothetical protein